MITRIRCATCGGEWPADTETCYKCNQPLAARPRQLGQGGQVEAAAGPGIYADGNQLVITEGNELPPRCPLCNSEDVVEPLELSIRRESKEMGGLSRMVKAGIDKLSGWNYTGPVAISVRFCQRHRHRFRNRILIGLAITAACLLYLAVAWIRFDKNAPHDSSIAIVAVAIMGAIGGVAMVEKHRQNPALSWFKPKRFIDRTVWVTGPCRPFLDSLPSRTAVPE